MSKPTIKPIPGEMSDIDVNFISLVKKGANGQKIQIYKADDEETTPAAPEKDVSGFMDVVKSFFFGKSAEDVSDTKQKETISFTQTIAVSDLMEGMWRVNDTLRTVMRNIMADKNITDKKAALTQAIDEYAAYMKGKVSTTAITKADYFDEPEIDIAKSGRMLSEKSITSIKNAITALQSLLSNAGGDEEIKKGADFDMTNEEITKIVKSALDESLKPITDRLDTLEKGDNDEGAQGTPAEGENNTSENIADIVKSAVAAAVQPIQDRLDKVEKSRGTSKGLEDNGENDEIKKSAGDVFDGYFVQDNQ